MEILQTKETNTFQNQLTKVYDNSKDEVSQLAGMRLTVSINSQVKVTAGCVDSPSLCTIKSRLHFFNKSPCSTSNRKLFGKMSLIPCHREHDK